MASKYISKMRRGTRKVDNAGNTLLNADGTPVQNDWEAYDNQPDAINPLDGELVVEFELDPDGKKTPRFKIGDGVSPFGSLDYIGNIRLPQIGEFDEGKILLVEDGKFVLGYPREYEKISITKFSHSAGDGLREYGETIDEVVLSWETNKSPADLELGNERLDSKLVSKTVSEVILDENGGKMWTLVATDERGAKDKKSTSIAAANGIYYGVASEPSSYDNAFVFGLTKELKNTMVSPITVNAGEGEYIYYALPKRIGKCSFTIDQFTGGFSLVDTIAFTNTYGYTEDYYIYRSDEAGRGQLTVFVTPYSYKQINILSFNSNISSTIEYRNVIDEVKLSWSFNKAPTSIELDGEPLDSATNSKTLINVPVTSDSVTWTLTAKDENGAVSTATESVNFVNGVYYGVGPDTKEYNNDTILRLGNKKLQNEKVSSITVYAGESQYIYYCLPYRLGECTFSFGMFTGGFNPARVINFTNEFGYTEQYRIYRSTNAYLENCTIKIS